MNGATVTAHFPFLPRPTPLIFERSAEGRRGTPLPRSDTGVKPAEEWLPREALRREPARLPEVPEFEVMRHYIELSLKNHHIERSLYPLGSCTMKYNPKINEEMARLPGFADLHPLTPDDEAQGALQLMHELAQMLSEIAGMDACTLQPAAGAHGEMTGIFLIKAYHDARGDRARRKILIPDSAHGTNPATVALVGFQVVPLRSDKDGLTDLAALKAALGPDVAGMMLTNPNTLGKFECDIREIADLIHDAGGLLYMDGANMNALIGVARPGDMGIDVQHYNLHKTFSTPHGGGGPGAGPVACKQILGPFLPTPVIVKDGDRYRRDWDRPQSIGRMHGFMGNFGVLVRAYAYIRMLGKEGMPATSKAAVLNANYIAARIRGAYELPYGPGMHESVFSATPLKKFGVKTLDVAKRLLDYGFHAPTIYFPLIVQEALMIEPTETATVDELDAFCEAMLRIAREAETEPELVTGAPTTTPTRRLDEGRAARSPELTYFARSKTAIAAD